MNASLSSSIHADPICHLVRAQPDEVVAYFCPETLQATAHRFMRGFGGVVSYAVKANARPEVLENLVAAGVRVFDVASPGEMRAARAACPVAVLHYNNPVRSVAEVAEAVRMGVVSYSVDSDSELDKLAGVGAGVEVSVRLALPIKGAAYDFGAKFGVGPEAAVGLLRRVVAMGFSPAITFHPGTQCSEAAAWEAYIHAAADVARRAGVGLARLNVGGGFAAHRLGAAPDLEAVFARISAAVAVAFDGAVPGLVCEPGRAMVSEAFVLAARVKALRPDGSVFLNDGIYGGLAEWPSIVASDRVRAVAPDGFLRSGAARARVVFGPTCDSLDRLPEPMPLAGDLAEGDYVLFYGMGAYSLALSTQFNGYGLGQPVTVSRL
jgi:ornithine decarboxylase